MTRTLPIRHPRTSVYRTQLMRGQDGVEGVEVHKRGHYLIGLDTPTTRRRSLSVLHLALDHLNCRLMDQEDMRVYARKVFVWMRRLEELTLRPVGVGGDRHLESWIPGIHRLILWAYTHICLY